MSICISANRDKSAGHISLHSYFVVLHAAVALGVSAVSYEGRPM